MAPDRLTNLKRVATTLDFNNTFDMNALKSVAEFYIHKMYPEAEKALATRKMNSLSFLENLQREVISKPPQAIENFSKADVMFAFEAAIQSASKQESKEVHKLLTQLIIDKIEKPIRRSGIAPKQCPNYHSRRNQK